MYRLATYSDARKVKIRGSEIIGDAENARPENDGQKLRGLENAGLENDGQNFSKLLAKLRGLENAGLENDGQTFSKM